MPTGADDNSGASLAGATMEPGKPPTVLILCSAWWSFPARTAMAFHELGWRVEAVCWYRQPLVFLTMVQRFHIYNPIRPLGTLERAIAQTRPALLVPCDDRAVAQLRELHKRYDAKGDARGVALIVSSIGDPERSAGFATRADLIALAREEGIRAPDMM